MMLVMIGDRVLNLDLATTVRELMQRDGVSGALTRAGVRVEFGKDHVVDLHGAPADALMAMIEASIPENHIYRT